MNEPIIEKLQEEIKDLTESLKLKEERVEELESILKDFEWTIKHSL